MSAMSKVTFGFSAVFNEMMQNMTTIENLSPVSSKKWMEARQFRVAVSSFLQTPLIWPTKLDRKCLSGWVLAHAQTGQLA